MQCKQDKSVLLCSYQYTLQFWKEAAPLTTVREQLCFRHCYPNQSRYIHLMYYKCLPLERKADMALCTMNIILSYIKLLPSAYLTIFKCRMV